jgi:hypothetical protein
MSRLLPLLPLLSTPKSKASREALLACMATMTLSFGEVVYQFYAELERRVALEGWGGGEADMRRKE